MGAISKAAKERKRLERGETIREPEGEGLNYYYIARAALAVGIAGVYYTYRPTTPNRSETPAQREEKRHNEALEQLAKENQVELLRELIPSRNYASSLVTRTLTSTIRTTLFISLERYVRKSEDVFTTL